MSEIARLYATIGANTQEFERATQRVERTAHSVGSTLRNLAALAAGAFAGAAVIDGARQFDRSLANIRSILGATAEETRALGAELNRIGARSTLGPQAVAAAYYDIVSGVQDATTHMAILTAAMNVAEAGQANLTTTTGGLVAVMNAYGLGASEATRVGDVFTRTVGVGVGTMDEFVSAMSPISTLARQAGVEFDDLGAMMAYMTAQGVGASMSATQIRAALTALIRPSTEMQRGLRRIGVESGIAAIRQYGLAGTLRLLADTTEGGALGMGQMLGSVEALNAALVLAGPDFESFLENFSSGLEGSTEAARALQLDSASAQFDQLKASIEGLAIAVGTVALPVANAIATLASQVVGAVLEAAPKILDALGRWFEWVPGLLEGTRVNIEADLATLGAGLANFMQDGWTQEMTDALKNIFTEIGQTVARLALGFIQTFKDIMRDLDIPQPIRDVVNLFLGPLERGLQALSELDWGKLALLGIAITGLGGGLRILSGALTMVGKVMIFELLASGLRQIQELIEAAEQGNWGEVLRNLAEAIVVLGGALIGLKALGFLAGAGGLSGLIFGAGGAAGAAATGAGGAAAGAAAGAGGGLLGRLLGTVGGVAAGALASPIGVATLVVGTLALGAAATAELNNWLNRALNPEPTIIGEISSERLAQLQEERNFIEGMRDALTGGQLTPEQAAWWRGEGEPVGPPAPGAARPRGTDMGPFWWQGPNYGLEQALRADDFLDIPTGTIPLSIPSDDRAVIEQGLLVPAEQFNLLMTGVDLTPTAADAISTGVDLTPTAAAIIARGINLNVPANMGQIIGEADDWAALMAGANAASRRGAGGGIGMRDSGGPGQAGVPYLIGRGAQPELFVPNTAGRFYPAGTYSGGGDVVIPVTLTLDGRTIYQTVVRERERDNRRAW